MRLSFRRNSSSAPAQTWKLWRAVPAIFSISLALLIVTTVSAVAVLSATKTDTFVGAHDGDGRADPGETIQYDVVINNTGAVPGADDATGVVYNDTIDPNTTLVGGSVAASPVGVNDTFPVTVVGNVSINSANLTTPFSVTANDYLGLNPLATISAFDATTSNGGTVSMTTSGANIGQFTYNPPAGYEGVDTFTYTLTDNTNATSVLANRQATVSITVSGMVWFINNTATACTVAGCGRLSNPFSTLAAFTALNNGTGNNPANNDTIFIYESATAYTGGIALRSGQRLIGQDATQSLSAITGLNPPTGSASFPAMNTGAPAATIQHTSDAVSVQTNAIPALIRGLSLDATTGNNAIDVTIANATSGTLEISDTIIVGAGAEGIDINCDGSGTLALTVQNNTWNIAGTHGNAANENAFDARTTATGVLNLNFSNNTNILASNVSSSGVLLDGSVGGTLTVTGFASNSVHQNTAGTGITVNDVIFDATPGGTFQQVSGGSTTIGTSGDGVGASGMVMTAVAGDLDFTDLDIVASNGTGLSMTGTGAIAASTGMRLTSTGNVASVNATGGPAVNISTATLDLRFATITSTNSASSGVLLASINDGTSASVFSAGAGSAITNAGTTDFIINSNNATVTYAGTITDDVGQLVSLSANSGDTKSFTGAITDGNDGDGSGILLTANGGTTIRFSGGLLLSTGSNAAFTATGGAAAVEVCDENPCGAGSAVINTLTTTTGTALNVANTTIGANNLEFRSISANGAVNGILLNATGSSGGLTVKGDGSGVANGSGGTITNTTGTGIDLTTTQNVSLTQINISNTGLYGINISSVTNFTYQDASIINAGNANEENTIQILNLFGITSKIEDVTLDDIQEDGIQIRQNATDDATRDELTIRRLNLQDHQAGFGEAGIEIQTDLASNFKLLVDDSDFAINTNAIMGVAMSTAATHIGTLTVIVQDSTFNGTTSFGSGSIQALGGGSGTANYSITGNTITSTKFDGIRVNNNDTGTTNTIITNNIITGSGATNNGEGITLRQDENGTLNALISNNNVSQIKANGIRLQSSDDTANDAGVEFNATVTNNLATVRSDGFGAGLLIDVGDGSGVAKNDACADISGNTLTGTETAAFFDFDITLQLNETADASLRIRQTSNANLTSTNNSASVSSFANPPNTITYNGGVCTQPPVISMLPATNQFMAQSPAETNPLVSAQASSPNMNPADRFNTVVDPGMFRQTTYTAGKDNPVTSVQESLATGAAVTTESIGGIDPVKLLPPAAPMASGENINVAIGTLPADKSVTIRFQVTVDALDPGEIRTRISNQGTVSSNVPNVLTTNGGTVDCEVGTETCTPVDRPDTTVTSINRQTPSSANTNASSVTWRVTFANAIGGLTSSNFTLDDPGGNPPTGESITSVTAVGGSPATQWDVLVNTGSGDGVLGLDFANDLSLSHDVPAFTGGQDYTIDKTAPTVTNVTASTSGCLGTSPEFCNVPDVVTIQVVFSEIVNVNTAGGTPTLALNSGGTASYSSGSGTTTLAFVYTVASGENAGDLDYTGISALALNGGTIQDAATNSAILTLPAPAAAGSLGANEAIVVDTTAPTTSYFQRRNPLTSPTNADTLQFEVDFSEQLGAPGTIGPEDFSVTGTTATATSLSVVNLTNGTYAVNVTGGDLASYNGVVGLDFSPGMFITDRAGNPVANVEPATDETYTLDNTGPTVTMSSAAPDPTNTSPIPVTVQFSEVVTGFTAGDITPLVNGTVSNFVAVDGDTYTFDLVPAGQGLVTADIAAGVAQDATGNDNTAATQFSRTYDSVAPTVSMSSAATNPTGTSPIPVTVTFSEAVTGFTAGDIAPVVNATVSNFAGSGATYTFDLVPIADGLVTADIAAGVAQDAAGNLNTAATQFSRLYDTAPPSVTINQASGQSDPTSASPINFTVVFNEAVTGFGDTASDVTLSGSAGATTATITEIAPNNGTTYNVAVSGMSTFGTVIASVPAGAADDLASQPNTASTSTDNTVTYRPPADLSITKTDGVTTATPGGSVTYTITASNAGPNDAPGSTVADTIPAILNATWTCVGAGGGTCTAGPVAGNINDTVNLPAGSSVTYTVNATISASATGSLANTATVSTSSSVLDTDPANNSATDTDTLAPMADLAITKTDGVTTAVPGGSVTYTITASNSGPSNAPGATIADTFPASLTATWTCVGAGGGTCAAGPVAGNINDTVNLPAGGSVTYTVSATINGAATGSLSNTATVSSSVTDPDPANNSATDTDTLTPQADLAITKTDGVTTATPGGSVTYTITASNSGPSNAPGATIADTFPASLTATWTCVGAGGGTCTAGPVAGNINDTVNLPAGGSVTYTVSATISAAATGSLSNTATVAAPAGVTDPDPANNSATDIDTLVPQADLSITKTDGVIFALAGNSVTYTITASNSGPSNATGATVADTFPASLSGVTWTCVGAGGGTCTAGPVAGNINDTVNLPAGGSVTYTASGTVSIGAIGTLSNTATVAAPGGVTDPNPGSNSATDTDTIVPPVGVTINQAAGQADPTNGSTINFTVVFGSAVTGFATGDVDLSASIAPGALVGTVTEIAPMDGTTYNVAVSGMTGDGAVTATIPAGVATDAQSQTNAASTSTDNTVIYDTTAPSVTINQGPTQSDPASTAPINFVVIFDEAVTGFDGTDVILSGTANPASAQLIDMTLDGTAYNIAVSGMTSAGTVIASIPAGSALDAATNPNVASTSTDNTVTFAPAAPVVTGIVRSDADPTNASTVAFTITFSAAVSGVDAGDFSLAASGVTGASISNVTGSGTTWTVTVNTGSGSGTLGLNLVDDDTIIDTFNTSLGGTGPGNGNFTGEVYTIDKIAPTASSLVTPPAQSGSTTYSFTVVFTDNLAIDITSLDGNDTRVMGPSGYNQLATLVSVSPATNGSPRTATYQVTPPGGSWDTTDGSTYVFTLQANQVFDTAGNSAAAASLGSLDVSLNYTTYLPLVVREGVPDLVASISISPNKSAFTAGEPVTISVTITNQGNGTAAPFWVDLYINPSSPPTAANQTWNTRCGLTPCHGIAWGVTSALAPGESITLSSQTLFGGYSVWPGWFAAGTSDIYAYVDSFNPGIVTGAVAESNEANNRAEIHGLSVTGQNPLALQSIADLRARPVLTRQR